MIHLEMYSEKYSNFQSFSPLVTFISSEQPLGDSLFMGEKYSEKYFEQLFKCSLFSPLVTFISSQQPLGESAALRAHEHTLCKVGRNWEKWEKGNKILEVWQKIKMHERGNKMFNFQPKRKELQNLSSIEICLAVLWEYRDVLRTVEDETKTSLLL